MVSKIPTLNAQEYADADHLASQAALAILHDGVVHLRGLLSRDLVHAWRHQFENEIMVSADAGSYPYRIWRLGDRRHHYIVEVHRAFNTPGFYAQPVLYGIAGKLMEDDFILATCAIALAEPDAKVQHTHRDQPLTTRNRKLNAVLPAVSITISIPLVETNSVAGGTEFQPGSHLHVDELDIPFQSNPTSLGDVMVWDSRCMHRGRPNLSEARRPVVLMYYQRPWFMNFLNYDRPDAEVKITDAHLDKVPSQYRHLFDWTRKLFEPPSFGMQGDGGCSCGSRLHFSECHGV